MSINDDKTLFVRYFEALNQKDIELADKLADECVAIEGISHMPAFPDVPAGSEAQKIFHRNILAANPDFHCAVEDLLFDGDKMILRGSVRMNNPTTGAVENNIFLEIDRLVDGKIYETWSLMLPGNW